MDTFLLFRYLKDVSDHKRAAVEVLKEYDFTNTKCSMMTHMMNTTFKVHSSQNCDHSKYVLRIHPEIGYDEDTVCGEMKCLQILNEEGCFNSPVPMLRSDGGVVSKIKMRGSAVRSAVVYSFIEGEFQNLKMSDHQLRLLGELAAQLHLAGERQYDRFCNINRPRFDWEGFFGPKAMFHSGDLLEKMKPEQRRIVNAVSKRVRTALDELGTTPDTFGFIHGDLYHKNVLFKEQGLGVIDFDLCGFGWYLYDLAVPYWPRKQGDPRESQRKVIDAYRCIRPIPEEHIRFIDDFLALRRLIEVHYYLRRIDPHLWITNIVLKMFNVFPALEKYLHTGSIYGEKLV